MLRVILPTFYCPKSGLLWFFVFFTSCALPFIPSVFASVVINEIFYDAPGSDDRHEWVEVYNPDSTTYDLSAWKFFEASVQHGLTLSQGSFSLSPESYAVIVDDAPTFLSDHLSFSGNLYDSTFSLSNTGEQISLLDGPSGNTVDSVTYSSLWGGGNGFSLERSSTTDSSNDSGDWHGSLLDGSPGSQNSSSSSTSTPTPALTPTPTVTPTPTPSSTPTPTPTSSPTPTPTPVVYPSGIYLTEFMPNSNSGEKEWVEIYNSNSSSVELTDWKIDDKEGGSSPQDFTATLLAQTYKQLLLSSNKFNNDSDTVRILRPNLTVADSYSYSGSHKGTSWAKNNSGDWFETSEITPDGSNKFVPVGGFPHKENIGELKKMTLGSKIDLTAYVSVPLDIFDEKEFYAVDDYFGIKISVTTLPAIKLKLGDKVHVASTIEELYSEKYIKSDTYEVIESNLRYPDPLEVDTGELTENNEGRLVKVGGKYQESDGDNFYIDDGTGPAKIYLKPSAGIIKLKMTRDDMIEVQGVISQYGLLKDGKPNLRLMPRFQSDLHNLTSEKKLSGTVLGAATELPVTGNTDFFLPLIMIGSGLVLKIVLKFSREVY